MGDHLVLDAPAAATAVKDGHAVTAVKDIAYGSFAGMVGKVIEYPFDTVKVRLQTQNHFKGPIDCFTQGLRTDGITGLYRGIAPPLVGAAAENAGLFFSYTISQNVLRKFSYPHLHADDKLPMPALVTCGAISGAFCSLILTPIELIKCKMQVQAVESPSAATKPPGYNASASAIPAGGRAYTTTSLAATASSPSFPRRYPGPIALIAEVIRAQGIRGMWHGQTGTFLRETGGSAVWFGAYEYVSLAFRRRSSAALATPVAAEAVTNTPGQMMVAGACAGVCYNGVLFPADTIKSRMQTAAVGAGVRPLGFLGTGAAIWREGGLAGLYRGCGVTVARAAPASAVIFLVYESLKAYF
ncbi:Mitoferrin [Drechslerella dactyloides]|uniref:Mitoferrin n=1 Tax=Drechslerella dactyloides TaxID=74499 RepID=A0AAD6ISU0_DREDA|nr:Mitoferrin [Drechslerella dactyloides]